jgi:hypothetical protein
MPSPNKVRITAYLDPEEYLQVIANSEICGLSISEYIKTSALNTKLTTKLDNKAFLELIKASADLGRLGGLLKLCLSENKLNKITGNKLLDEIKDLKKVLESKIMALKNQE